MTTVSIINLKGGTGKTTTAVNLAAELVRQGERVLVIDADPQHNTTDFFGIEDGASLTDVMQCAVPLSVAVTRLHVPGIGEIGVLGSDMGLWTFDVSRLLGSAKELDALDLGLYALRNEYDFTIIDCPPGFTAASVAALRVSDAVIVPVTADAYALDGLTELMTQVRSLRGSELPCFALLTKSTHSRVSMQMENELRAHSRGCRVFKQTIPASVKVSESTFAKKPLCLYAPKNMAAISYKCFAEEFSEVIQNG